MIIGFLGKGGSGKTTLSTAMVHFLHAHNNTVLAIDADHNMDLTYNLGINTPIPYLGEAMPYLRSFLKSLVNIEPHEHYRDMFASFTDAGDLTNFAEVRDVADLANFPDINFPGIKSKSLPKFTISEHDPDTFTKAYSTQIKPKLNIMSAGPHTEDVLQGNSCSHSLSTPLRIYLPLLELRENEYVVVDEKAGRDGAGTGTPSGFDIAFICTEPTLHGLKAASQIAEILDIYNTPYEFIVNKAEQTHMSPTWTSWKDFLSKEPIVKIPRVQISQTQTTESTLGLTNEFNPYTQLAPFMDAVHEHAKKYASSPEISNTTRKQRSIQKFKKQKEFIIRKTAQKVL